jgi:hypothetical protein
LVSPLDFPWLTISSIQQHVLGRFQDEKSTPIGI